MESWEDILCFFFDIAAFLFTIISWRLGPAFNRSRARTVAPNPNVLFAPQSAFTAGREPLYPADIDFETEKERRDHIERNAIKVSVQSTPAPREPKFAPREWIPYPKAPIRKSHRRHIPSRPVEGEVTEIVWWDRKGTMHLDAKIVEPDRFPEPEILWDEYAKITVCSEPERTQRESSLENLDPDAILDGIRRSPSPSEEEQESQADATIIQAENGPTQWQQELANSSLRREPAERHRIENFYGPPEVVATVEEPPQQNSNAAGGTTTTGLEERETPDVLDKPTAGSGTTETPVEESKTNNEPEKPTAGSGTDSTSSKDGNSHNEPAKPIPSSGNEATKASSMKGGAKATEDDKVEQQTRSLPRRPSVLPLALQTMTALRPTTTLRASTPLRATTITTSRPMTARTAISRILPVRAALPKPPKTAKSSRSLTQLHRLPTPTAAQRSPKRSSMTKRCSTDLQTLMPLSMARLRLSTTQLMATPLMAPRSKIPLLSTRYCTKVISQPRKD